MDAPRELDNRPLRFGVFELNPASGELRKHGVRIRLQDQPLKVLLSLLQTPGEICTREDLIRKIWPEGTFVDYERGLNVAITRLRQVLGDSAESPRYIETIGRKGYRFIAPVEPLPTPDIPPSRVENGEPAAPPVIGGATAVPGAPQPRVRGAWAYAAVLIIGIAIGGAVGWWHVTSPPSQRLMRLSVPLGPDMTVAGFGAGTLLAISPDGTRFAVSVSGSDGKMRLATRRFDQNQPTPLAGTENAASPFFSPDGQWIAFFAEGKLKKIPVEGGAPVTLCEADTHAAGRASMFYPTGSWGEDGNIVASLNVIYGLSRVPATGGSPALLQFKQKQGEIYRWPQVLPGGQAVLFTASYGDYEDGNIEILVLGSGERKIVQRGGILGRYLPSGHLVYVQRNTLFAAPFNLKALKLSGSSREVLEDMGSRYAGWNFDFSQTGSLLYLSQPIEPTRSIFWLDGAGRLAPLQTTPGYYASPRFSPDGKRLAFSMSGRSEQGIWVQDIWVQNLDSGTVARLTSLPGVNDSPVWTADGANLIFRSVSQPNPGIYAVRADGSGEVRRLSDLTTGVFPSSVSPDNRRLTIWDWNIWTAELDTSRQVPRLAKAVSFLQNPFNPPVFTRIAAAFSPDGRWLAYSSLESGMIEVYVRPFPGPGGKWRISTGGGVFPTWSRNGRELFFLPRPANRLMVRSYRVKGDSFIPDEPRVWYEKPLLDLGELNCCDIAPDGRRFAVVLHGDGTAEQKPAGNLTILLNFFDELRRRVPAGID